VKPHSMEAELGLYWRLARGRSALRLCGARDAATLSVLAEIEDDLDAMAQHSEWPALRAAAAKLLMPEQKAAVR
jgi:hypothetical protein